MQIRLAVGFSHGAASYALIVLYVLLIEGDEVFFVYTPSRASFLDNRMRDKCFLMNMFCQEVNRAVRDCSYLYKA